VFYSARQTENLISQLATDKSRFYILEDYLQHLEYSLMIDYRPYLLVSNLTRISAYAVSSSSSPLDSRFTLLLLACDYHVLLGIVSGYFIIIKSA
jgi:hypothetical protein